MLEGARARVAGWIAPRPAEKQAPPMGMVNIVGPGMRGSFPRLSTADLLNGYSTLPWLRAVVDKIADIVGAPEWLAFQRIDRLERRPLDDHLILDTLHNGNAWHTGIELRRLLAKYLCLTDEAFFLKERNGARAPMALWPVPPNWIKRLPVLGFGEYEIQFGHWNVKVPPSEVLHFVGADPAQPYGRGSGSAKALLDELETDEEAAKFLHHVFKNRARPDLIISAGSDDQPIGGDAITRLEEGWLEKAQGFRKAGLPFFVQGGRIDVKEIDQNLQQLQVIDLRRFSREAVMNVYGLPPEALGVLENSNRATIEAAELFLTKHVAVPKLKGIRAAVNRGLARDYDPRLEVDFENPVQEDKEHIRQILSQHPYAFKVDEIRERAEHEPLENGAGEVHPVPFNVLFLENLGDAGDLEEPAEVEEEDAIPERLKAMTKALDLADVESLLQSVRLSRLTDAYRPLLEAIMRTFGERAMRLLGSSDSFDIADPRVVEFIRERGAERLSNVNTTTQRRVREALVEGVEAGEGVGSLAKRIGDVFEEARGARARTIARTETVRPATFATLEGIEQAGGDGKEWLSSRDAIVRDSHAIGSGMDGQIVALRADFVSPVTGARGQGPGMMGRADEDVNCRCAALPVVSGRSLGGSEEKRTQLWRQGEAQRVPFERRVRVAMRTAFRQQRREILEHLEELARDSE